MFDINLTDTIFLHRKLPPLQNGMIPKFGTRIQLHIKILPEINGIDSRQNSYDEISKRLFDLLKDAGNLSSNTLRSATVSFGYLPLKSLVNKNHSQHTVESAQSSNNTRTANLANKTFFRSLTSTIHGTRPERTHCTNRKKKKPK